MSGDDDSIPTLTEVVSLERPGGTLSPEQIAELQADLSARVMRLADELIHAASRDIEAILLERVCGQLRAQLPELVDDVIRERLSR